MPVKNVPTEFKQAVFEAGLGGLLSLHKQLECESLGWEILQLFGKTCFVQLESVPGGCGPMPWLLVKAGLQQQ